MSCGKGKKALKPNWLMQLIKGRQTALKIAHEFCLLTTPTIQLTNLNFISLQFYTARPNRQTLKSNSINHKG